MYKVYYIDDGSGEQKLIPSVGFVSSILKMVEDAIILGNKSFNGFNSIEFDIETIELKSNSEVSAIYAKDIETDDSHQFVDDNLLSIFKDKPSTFDIETMLSKYKEEIRKEINDTYMKIINTPNIINKLRDIAEILQEDDIANGIIETIASKVSEDKFKEHTDSNAHMTNNDRKALNLFLKFLNGGGIDWLANEGSSGYIKNKPESLPADGGNANTVANLKPIDLVRGEADFIIGSKCGAYSEDICDLVLDNSGKDCYDAIDEIVNTIPEGATVLFRRGEYFLNCFDLSSRLVNSVIIGDNNRSVIACNKMYVNEDITIKDMDVYSDTVFLMNGNILLDNVRFYDCTIHMNNLFNSTIRNCTFINCTFTIENDMHGNMIVLNRFKDCECIKYLSKNNIIENNIEC